MQTVNIRVHPDLRLNHKIFMKHVPQTENLGFAVCQIEVKLFGTAQILQPLENVVIGPPHRYYKSIRVCAPRFYPRQIGFLQHTSLVDVARHDRFRKVFDLGFKTFILVAYEYPEVRWDDGLSHDETQIVVNQFYDLTRHLITIYKNSGKTFILQNWEGDNMFALYDKTPPSQAKIQGLIDYFNARMDGIRKARDEMQPKGVRVFGAVEICKISTTFAHAPRLIDVVVPYTHADLYSYSNWETQDNAKLLEFNLHLLREKAPPSDAFGENNLMMAEFGWPSSSGGDERQLDVASVELETAIKSGVQYAVYWELMCNEFKKPDEWTNVDLRTVQPKNDDMKGFWLIKPDGTRTPMYHYLKNYLHQ